MTGKRIQEVTPRRGVAASLVAGVVAVAVTAGALAVQDTPARPDDPVKAEPSSVALTSAALLCPASVPDGPELAVGRAPGEAVSDGAGTGGGSGKVTVRRAAKDKSRVLKIAPDAVTGVADAPKAMVVNGTGDAAPGLFGARFGPKSQPAAGECVTPAGERWFVGVGAGGLHESRLLLANPDRGPAVADLTIWSTSGEKRLVESRGLTVPGGRSSELDLAKVVPEREELAVRLTVTRGRLGASMQDSYTPSEAESTTDWLPRTGAPDTELVIPGLTRKADENTLVLVNPGEDEGRVSLQVRGASSQFAPADLSDIRVPAGRVVTTELTKDLKQAIEKEDGSLVLSSTVPVAGSLRTVFNGDLAHLPALEARDGASSAVVGPTGKQTLLLTAAGQSGVADIRFLGAEEADAAEQQARLRNDVTTAVEVPKGSSAVVVDADISHLGSLRSAVEGGVAVLPLRQLETERLTPEVRPAWP